VRWGDDRSRTRNSILPAEQGNLAIWRSEPFSSRGPLSGAPNYNNKDAKDEEIKGFFFLRKEIPEKFFALKNDVFWDVNVSVASYS
jgi:hypothetical protein